MHGPSSHANPTTPTHPLQHHLSSPPLLGPHPYNTLSHPHDDGSVLSELAGGSDASVPLATRSNAVAATTATADNPATSVSDRRAELRTSINPAHEVAQYLNSRRSSYHPAGRGRNNPTARGRARIELVFDTHPAAARQIYDGVLMMDGALPDDDGMHSLRQKLHVIRTLAVSTEEMAHRMHYLMAQDYLAHKANIAGSPPDLNGGRVEGSPAEVSSLAPPIDPANPYNLRIGDLEPCWSPLPVTPASGPGDSEESMDEDAPPMLGCMHYKRNVKIQCFDCHRWYPCRHCHDLARDLPFPHHLNRKKTQNMLCMLCRTPQPAAEICVNCGEYAAWYYCPRCKLWDNDSNKRIYHCDDCGICRVGEGLGKDYVHCRRCNVCISISTSAAHPCIERATEGDCPLCLVRLFESPTRVVSLPCGHYMHGECYRDLMAVTYKCPVCSKSAVNMELQWRKLDDEIRAQPMPDDDEELEGLLPLAVGTAVPSDGEDPSIAGANGVQHDIQPRRPRTVWIGCNDCNGRCWTMFHWLGLKCQVCDSYNTTQMAPTAFRETEAERVIRQQQQQQQHHRQHDFTGDAVLRDAGIGANTDDDAAMTRGLDVPSSPSQLPVAAPVTAPVDRARGAQSPSRRYFVQEEEPRRPSFNAGSRFSTPILPSMPNLPNMPNFPQLPDMPRIPQLPNLPHMPNMPNIELPRFSPYDMLNAVSRSWSPMRFYLPGLDARETDAGPDAASRRLRPHSPTSVHSDPTADATTDAKPLPRRASDAPSLESWAFADAFLSGDEGSSHRRRLRPFGAARAGDTSSSSGGDEDDDDDDDDDSDDVSSAGMGEDEDEDDGVDAFGEDMELFGHR